MSDVFAEEVANTLDVIESVPARVHYIRACTVFADLDLSTLSRIRLRTILHRSVALAPRLPLPIGIPVFFSSLCTSS